MGQALPTGIVTFLFTDVEGSTRLVQRVGGAFGELLERHRVLLREACGDGAEFGSAGDALVFAFADPSDAIRAATKGQRAIEAEAWPDDRRIRVRIGVHTGRADLLGGDYVGVAVHRAARICSAAHGGQILVSAETAALVDDTAPLRKLGAFQLKDFDEPAALCQVEVGDLQSEFPPPRTSAAIHGVLPREATSLIGRERELVEVRDLLREHRLVTLTGAGGSGKTRLGLRVARNMAPTLGGPAGFVSLAPLDHADQVPGVIGRAFEQDGVGSWGQACELLRRVSGLVVLDNAEHLPELSGAIAGVLGATDDLRILVTSRAPVGVQGEHLYPVDPLPEATSIELLIERTREHTPSYEPGGDELDELRGVAARLDGLPLALELAAARLRSISAAALRSRLDRQLDLLKTTRVDVPERQQTMRATIGWSYDLLSEDDQALFESLAVFPAPARIEAIAMAFDASDIDTLDGLARLIDASLVRMRNQDEPRYTMLEPVRQFATERLAESGRDGPVKRRMIEAYPAFRLTDNAVARRYWAYALAEAENAVRAMSYCADLGEWDHGTDIAFFWANLLGHIGAQHRMDGWVELAARQGEFASPYAIAQFRILAAECQRYPGELPLFQDAAQAARDSGDPALTAIGLRDLFYAALARADVETASAALDELHCLAQRDVLEQAVFPLLALLLAAVREGPTGVLRREPAVLELLASRPPSWRCTALADLAQTWLRLGDADKGMAYALECAEVAHEHGMDESEAEALVQAATGGLIKGSDPRDATSYLIRACAITIGGDAYKQHVQALLLHAAAGQLARCRHTVGAAQVVGAVGDALAWAPRDPDIHLLNPAQGWIDEAKAALPEDRWAQLAAQTQPLTLDAAVDLAGELLAEAQPAGDVHEPDQLVTVRPPSHSRAALRRAPHTPSPPSPSEFP